MRKEHIELVTLLFYARGLIDISIPTTYSNKEDRNHTELLNRPSPVAKILDVNMEAAGTWSAPACILEAGP